MNLAVGFFDGVHLGHQRILAQADAVLTFSNHPATVFAPDRAPRLLMTRDDRLAAIEGAIGTIAPPRELETMSASDGRRPGEVTWGRNRSDSANCRVRALDFTPAFAAQQPSAFADWLRAEYPSLDTLYCGANWTFGADGAGNADFLRAQGFHVEVVPYAAHAGEPISSTRIRRALAAGNLADANAMLGRSYALAGRVAAGKGLGRTLGFPTLNILPELADPPLSRGVYAVATPLGRGLANWGVAPTMGDRAWTKPVLEVHLLESFPSSSQSSYEHRSLNARPASLRVEFLSFLRPERTFSSPAELQTQIARDVASARLLF